MEPKRKRGRPPKIQKSQLLQPLEFPASHLDESSARDLQFGYKILQEILSIPKSRLMLEKPDENLFGLHDYYEIIKYPMWLSEVTRKFENEEYKELKDVLADFRLTLENCYKFWGANHKFSKHAFRIEKMLEKHLRELPVNLRTVCNFLNDHSANDSINESDSALLDAYQSKILQSLGRQEKMEKDNSNTISEEELYKWENDVLMSKQAKKQINYIPELADIGFFLKLTHQTICIKPVTQYEIERMLLIPKESSTLATLMTAFLCPTAMRGSLYLKPLMTYEVWSVMLRRKLESWYNAYLKYQNKIQIFLKYGIEPFFWEIVGNQNPLIDAEYHTLTLLKKAWILKTLCTTSFHSNKKIEEYFNTIEDFKLRGNIIYEDSKFIYISEFLPEIRVYRIGKHEGDYDNVLKEIIPEYLSNPNNISMEDVGNNMQALSRKQKFHLIAYDRESLEMLTSTFCRKKKSVMAIEKIMTTEKNKQCSLNGLKSMYLQWKKFIDRLPIVVENSRNYWINKATSPAQTLNIEDADGSHNDSSLIIFGKRPTKKKYTFEEVHSDDENVNDEKPTEECISDWEDGNIRRSKRIRKSKKFPRKWERRYDDGIYETFNRPSTIPRSYSSQTSRLGNTDLTNPNDYVNFLRFQQQKINSFYNAKKNGLTITKTISNITKRSIVNAAVENAVAFTQMATTAKVNKQETNVLMISMASSPLTSTNSSLNSEPSSNSNMTTIVNNTRNNEGIHSSANSNSTQDSNESFLSPPITNGIQGENAKQSTSSMVETFLSEWGMAKESGTKQQTTEFPVVAKAIAGDSAATVINLASV